MTLKEFIEKERSENNEEYFEFKAYNELIKLKPDNFYLHRPIDSKYINYIFEARLKLMNYLGLDYNYYAIRHKLGSESKWFCDWVYINNYEFDYIVDRKWNPTIIDKFRYRWLMISGFKKEFSDYYQLMIKNDSKTININERKFYNKYQDHVYNFYNEYKYYDELQFFRIGSDISPEVLKNKPLFPNVAEYHQDDPLLAYWIKKRLKNKDDFEGVAFEHIPEDSFRFYKKLSKLKINRKWNKGEKAYYTDIRPMFNPETKKIHDIQFIMHVFKEHDGNPPDINEKNDFNKIFDKYKQEITHIAQSMKIPELTKLNIAYPRRQLNPLYVAYKQRWFKENPVKDFIKIFHGVSREEYQEIVNKQFEYMNKPENKKSKKQKVKKWNIDVNETIKNIIDKH